MVTWRVGERYGGDSGTGSYKDTGEMDGITLFGLIAVSAMVTFYAVEDRHPVFVLLFAAACGLASIYGFLAGAWPFGVVEAIWAVIALVRWRRVHAA